MFQHLRQAVGAEAQELAMMMSDDWFNFTRGGDPNHNGLPYWPMFNAEQGSVTIINKTCEVKQ